MGKINLNFSQIGGALKKLSFLRTYSMLLLPLGIVIAAAAIFTTALLMGKSFRAKAEKQSVPIGREIDSRLNKAISTGQVEMERQYQQQLEQDANKIEQMAMESSQRELLDYGIFPEPKELRSDLFTQFGHIFCTKIDEDIKRLKGGDCPTEEEIRASVTKASAGLRTAAIITPGTTSNSERIKEELCMQRARISAVYINPADIAGYSFWEDYKYTKPEEALKDCWSWQVGYWIIEDVLDTVGKMNEGSKSVLDSPVKRIVYIGFTSPDKMLTGGVGIGTRRWKVSQDKPKDINKPEEMLAEPCTGRMSNAEIDVVQFSIDAVVETDQILPFMKELCSVKEHTFRGYDGEGPAKTYKHNQITILQSNIKPINSEDTLQSRYRYGSQPTAEVELVCEYIFNKKGYEAVNPLTPKVEQQTLPPGQ
jgi:hypothetical protein